MIKNKLIIAAAGSGKTTHLVNEALARTGNILILTYTLSNESVIKRRFIQKANCIPRNITVQTWFSFLLQHGVRPYQGCLHESLFEHNIQGMLLVNQRSGFRFKSNNVPRYWGENDFSRHYFTGSYKIYSDKISKFTVKCNEQSQGAVIERLSRIYNHILIDEIQDLAGYDLELLKLFFKSNIATLLVGDPRQVTYLTHIESKYDKYKNGKIQEFITNELGKTINCEIDETTLGISHRCNLDICEYSSLLYSRFPKTIPCSCCLKTSIGHQGVFSITQSKIKEYIQYYCPMQLRWDRRKDVISNINVMNFGESKGETFDRILIYPTKEIIAWIKNHSIKLPDATRAKFYVALTRSRFSVAIVMDDDKDYIGLKKWENTNE